MFKPTCQICGKEIEHAYFYDPYHGVYWHLKCLDKPSNTLIRGKVNKGVTWTKDSTVPC